MLRVLMVKRDGMQEKIDNISREGNSKKESTSTTKNARDQKSIVNRNKEFEETL